MTLSFFRKLFGSGLLVVSGFLFMFPSAANAASLYWYQTGADSQWTTLTGNWWNNSSHTSQASSLPSGSDDAVLIGPVAPIANLDTWTQPNSIDASGLTGDANATGIIFTSSSSNYVYGTLTGNATFEGSAVNSGLSISGNAAFYGSSTNQFGSVAGTATYYSVTGGAITLSDSMVWGVTDGADVGADGLPITMWVFNDNSYETNTTLHGSAVFNGTSRLFGTVAGNATFNDTAYNQGTVDGIATFNSSAYNSSNGPGKAIFNDTSYNLGTFSGDAIFNDQSTNQSTINGDAVFNDSSENTNMVNGNATFYGTSQNNSSVGGNAYFYDSSNSSGSIQGNATFFGDQSAFFSYSAVNGSVTRIYTSDISPTDDFTIVPSNTTPHYLTIVADGATVNLASSTYDASTTFAVADGGAFIPSDPNEVTPSTATVTPAVAAVTLSVLPASVGSASLSASSSLIFTGGTSVTMEGFNYGLTQFYGSTTSATSSAFAAGQFSQVLASLACDTAYHVQAFAVNSSGTTTSADAVATTSACAAPSLSVSAVSAVSTSSVSLNANVTNDGGAAVTVEGFNYGTTTAYTASTSASGSFGAGSFSQNISGLECDTDYHYQAFAVNTFGTATSSDQTFTTSSCPVTPSPVVSNSGSSSSGGSSASSYAALAAVLAPSASTTAYLNSLAVASSSLPLPGCPAGWVCVPNSSPAIVPPGAVPIAFTHDLSLGMTDPDVLRLQQYLNANGYPVAPSGSGSSGHETSYFGSLTKSALVKFQKAHAIPATGYFGPITRAFLK